MSAKTALIIGAPGQVGQCVLKELLASSHYNKVGEYGRRLTDASTLSAGKEKLEQKTIDFERLSESGLKDGKWDVVFITLGTSKKNAGSAEAFEKIDRESKGMTEVGLASLGYSDTIVYRPAVLAGTNRSQKRFEETVMTSITGLLSHFTSSLEIKIPLLGKSLAMAGWYGSENLPAVAKGKKAGPDATPFTLVENAGAIALGNTPWE